MRAKILTVAGLAVALALPAESAAKPPLVEPEDGPDPRGLTLQGSGLARVKPPAELNEKTIRRAVEAARAVARVNALRDARRRARALAKAAGLTLGAVQAITGRLSDSERLFGPDRFCRRGRCRAPGLAGASVRVTFATVETSAVVPSGRVVAASGSETASARPRRRANPSIRAALRRAQLASDSLALDGAGQHAGGVARAAGFELGSLFALAEEPRQSFAYDLLNGPFGPGRFCGSTRRGRRCYIPAALSVLRVTFVVAD
jgi:hypothetical protein